MGLVARKGMATSVVVDPEFVWSVPEHWTLEDASTVPVVYSTVSNTTANFKWLMKHFFFNFKLLTLFTNLYRYTMHLLLEETCKKANLS